MPYLWLQCKYGFVSDPELFPYENDIKDIEDQKSDKFLFNCKIYVCITFVDN